MIRSPWVSLVYRLSEVERSIEGQCFNKIFVNVKICPDVVTAHMETKESVAIHSAARA